MEGGQPAMAQRAQIGASMNRHEQDTHMEQELECIQATCKGCPMEQECKGDK